MEESDQDDDAATAIEREGFTRVTPTLLERTPPHDPATYWRTGFSFPAVGADYAFPREDVVEDLTASLADGENRLLVGRAGAGKSTACKLVVREWLGADRGPVYHTDASVPTPLPEFDAVAEEIRSTDGHVLVVVEDALEPENHPVLELVEVLSDVEGVSFLLEARRPKVENLEDRLAGDRGDVAERVGRLRGGAVTDYEMPGLDADTCERIVEFYEEVTDATVVRSPEAIFGAVRSGRGAGGDEMLHLGYVLTGSDPGSEESGMERSVAQAVERYEDPSGGLAEHGDLLGRVVLLVNVCNAAGLPIRAELIHALAAPDGSDDEDAGDRTGIGEREADRDVDHAAIDAVVEALTGEFLFEDDARPGYRTNHKFWSGMYVKHVVTMLPPDRARERFGEAVNALLSVADPAVRRGIEARFAGDPAPEATGEAGGETPGPAGTGEEPSDPTRSGSEHLVGTGGADPRSYLTGVLPVANLVTRIAEFGLRWPVLATAFGTAGDSPVDLPERCSASTESAFVSYRGRMHRKAGDYEAAVAEFEHARDLIDGADVPEGTVTKIRVRYRNDLGEVDLERGDLGAAEGHFERALEAAREVRYRRGEALALANLGDVARKRGEAETALERYEASIERSTSLDDHGGVADALANLGNLHYRQGAIDEAVEAYEEAMRIYRELGDRSGEATCLNNLGVISHRREDLAAAERYHRESLEVSRQIGELLGEAKSYNNLGIVARSRGEFEEAAERFRESLELKREIGNREGIASSLGNLGVVARVRGNFEEAERYHRESLAIYEEVGNESERARALLNLGTVHRESGRFEEAREFVRRAMDAYDGVGNLSGVVTCHEELARIAGDADDRRGALEEYERAVEVATAADARPSIVAVIEAIDLAEELDSPGRAADICELMAPLIDDIEDADGREMIRERCRQYT